MVPEDELSFAGPEHRLDPLAHRSKRSVATGLSFAIGAQEPRAEAGHVRLKLLARESFVGKHGVALQVGPLEHLGRDLRSGALAGASSKAIGIPSAAHSK